MADKNSTSKVIFLLGYEAKRYFRDEDNWLDVRPSCRWVCHPILDPVYNCLSLPLFSDVVPLIQIP